MKTTNKALCIAGATLSAPALIFCLDVLSEVHTGTSAVFMGILASLFASMFTICAMVFLNQKLLVFKNIFKNANDAITIIDAKGRYIWQNRANKNLCGFDNDELSHEMPVFYVNDKRLSVADELNKISEFSGIFSVEANGQIPKKVWIAAFKVEDELGNTVCFVEMKRNISEFLKLLEHTNAEKERLDRKAKSDFLTGTYNRAGFLSRMEEKIDGSIVFVDIDKFKDINDMFGHAKGDEVLRSVAKIISQNLRTSDIVCRWGGEEFVLWVDTDTATTAEICEKIRQKIEITKPEGIFTTCSFGVAKLDKNLEICIENADNAMYFVKQNGRNSVKVFENNNQNP